MNPVAVITDKLEGYSIDTLAFGIERELVPHRPVRVVRPGKDVPDAIKGACVINLNEGYLGDLTKQFRWARPRSVVTVLAGNWEGTSLADQFGLMAHHLSPKSGGVPLRLAPHSRHTFGNLQSTTKQYLAPAAGRGFLANVVPVMCGIEPGFEPGANDPDVLVVPYNRVSSQKHPKLHAEASASYAAVMASRGVTVDHRFYCKTGGPFTTPEGPYAILPQPDSRDQFRTNIAQCGMFLSTSLYESFGLYYLELLASGVVGVFLDKPWVHSLLPGYRYVASPKNLAAMMLHVRDNYAEARSYVLNDIRPYVLASYPFSKFAHGLAALGDSLGAVE